MHEGSVEAGPSRPVTGTRPSPRDPRPDSGREAPDPSLAVQARGLTKHYRHPWTMRLTRGLEALDLDVPRGEVVGYLGPNGAGKTTTLKLLTGLHKPKSGPAG